LVPAIFRPPATSAPFTSVALYERCAASTLAAAPAAIAVEAEVPVSRA
jgi:hypothetical protein